MKYWNSIFCISPVTRTHATSVCMGAHFKILLWHLFCYNEQL